MTTVSFVQSTEQMMMSRWCFLWF